MNAIARALSGLAAVLDARHRHWALVGGLAVSCHVDPRFTRDVDVAVAVEDDADAEALIHSLSAEGYVVAAAVEQDAAGRLATVRMMSAAQADDVPLDVRGPIAATAPSKAHGDAHPLRPRGEQRRDA